MTASSTLHRFTAAALTTAALTVGGTAVAVTVAPTAQAGPYTVCSKRYPTNIAARNECVRNEIKDELSPTRTHTTTPTTTTTRTTTPPPRHTDSAGDRFMRWLKMTALLSAVAAVGVWVWNRFVNAAAAEPAHSVNASPSPAVEDAADDDVVDYPDEYVAPPRPDYSQAKAAAARAATASEAPRPSADPNGGTDPSTAFGGLL